MRAPLDLMRTMLRNTIAMYRIDGVLVAAPSWGLLTCRCREADAALLAIEFDLRLAVAGEGDDFPCGNILLTRIPDEYATPADQGKHD